MKKIIFIIIFLLSIFVITSCGETDSDPLSGIVFSDLEVTYDGHTHYIEAHNIPKGYTVKYSSNVFQIEVGEYEISATIFDSNNEVVKILTATLKIKKAEEIPTKDVYTVEEILQIMANYSDGDVSQKEYTVKGTAKSSSYDSEHDSYNIYLETGSNKVFEIYSGKLASSITSDFKNANAMAGLEIVCKGYLKLYKTTYEMSYIKSLDASPLISSITGSHTGGDQDDDTIYTPDALLQIMANYTDGQVSTGKYIVKGTVQSSTYDSTHKSYTLTLEAGKPFQIYSAQLSQEIVGNFTAENALAGLEIICKGYLKLFKTTYEMSYINELNDSPIITSISGSPQGDDTDVTLDQDYTNIVPSFDIVGLEFNDANYKYDENAHSLILNGLKDGYTVSYTNNEQTQVGVYLVTAKIKDSNDNIVLELVACLTISSGTHYEGDFVQ